MSSDLETTLRGLLTKGAELAALNASTRQNTQAIADMCQRIGEIVDLVKKMHTEKINAPEPKEHGPDMAAAMVEAVRALLPPQVNVTPTLTTAPGAAWAVEGTGADGRPFKLKITKL